MLLYFGCFFVLLLLTQSCSAFAAPKQVPITVLSGFLGSGKTTLLKHLLENEDGLKIAVVVNDMAEVNIDSKLVASSAARDNSIVQLQNGCACCTKSEELLGSIAELVTLSDMRGDDFDFDHIVIELSGISDPLAVRSKFQEAIFYDMPIMERVRLDTMVTVVDCSTFWDYFRSSSTIAEIPELSPESSMDEMVDDQLIPTGLLDVMGDGPPSDEMDSAVSSLLVTQVETADIVLLNKIDLVTDVASMEEMLGVLNSRAKVFRTEHGRLPWSKVLGSAEGKGVAQAGVLDDHKDSVKHAEHSHASGHQAETTHDTDHSHNHSHGTDQHEHSESHSTHSHSHQQAHEHVSVHEHGHNSDTTMSHVHSHDHNNYIGGIGSFVYRARRPFHPQRLAELMQYLPVQRGIPDVVVRWKVEEETQSVLRRIVRSKGFYWQANSHAAALYWSQAGSSLDLSCLGSWWATLPRYRWPAASVDEVLADFDDPEHDEFDDEFRSVGDRRQEIVFIGPSLGGHKAQSVVREAFDRCILTDDEWESYKVSRNDERELATLFPSSTKISMLTY